jgi:hypothetical protein
MLVLQYIYRWKSMSDERQCMVIELEELIELDPPGTILFPLPNLYKSIFYNL